MPDPQATTTTVSLKKKLDCARELRRLILRHRERTDEARQLAQPVVEAMASLGLFLSQVPASAGGEEWPRSCIRWAGCCSACLSAASYDAIV